MTTISPWLQGLLKAESRPIARKEFTTRFNAMEGFVLETLLRYAKDNNQELYEQLQSTDNVEHVLWNAYVNTMDRAIDANPNYHQVIAPVAELNKANIVEVLFNHVIATPTFTDATDQIPYGLIGRGFYAEGANMQLENGTIASIIGAKTDVDDPLSYAKELVNHEVLGHGILGLDDHFDDRSADECIMAVTPSNNEFQEVSSKYEGRLRFCDPCDKVYRQVWEKNRNQLKALKIASLLR